LPGQQIYSGSFRLNSLDDLFDASSLTPLSADYADYSDGPVLQFIADEIYANSSYDSAAVTIELPAAESGRTSEAETQAAVRRWASAKLRSVEHDVAATRWRGWRSLLAGVVLFAVAIGLSRLMDDATGDLADTISRGLEVAAWVVLWFPIDMLLFSVWQFRLDRRAYRIVHDMEIRVTSS
jgi:hypothetical protein